MVSFALHGVGVSGGVAIGRAQLVSHATLEVAHYAVSAKQVPGEIERFELAVKEVQRELESLHSAMTSGDVPGEFGDAVKCPGRGRRPEHLCFAA